MNSNEVRLEIKEYIEEIELLEGLEVCLTVSRFYEMEDYIRISTGSQSAKYNIICGNLSTQGAFYYGSSVLFC